MLLLRDQEGGDKVILRKYRDPGDPQKKYVMFMSELEFRQVRGLLAALDGDAVADDIREMFDEVKHEFEHPRGRR
jgi:hypothetical protein